MKMKEMFPVSVRIDDGVVVIEQYEGESEVNKINLTPEQADTVADWISEAAASVNERSE